MTQNNTAASAVSEGEMTANALLEALGTTLEPDLLVEALTHRSFSHENPGAKNYERLEFLGDAVLELVSTETLYKAHPDMNEGQLAKMRAKAVSEESLSKIAREKLNAGPYILLGHGESDQGDQGRDHAVGWQKTQGASLYPLERGRQVGTGHGARGPGSAARR